jgi:hypothetical protein
MTTFGPAGTHTAEADAGHTYLGLGTGSWSTIDYSGIEGPITVNFINGTVTRPGGVDTLVNIPSVYGSPDGTTIISADNEFGGFFLVPTGGNNTFIANGVDGTQDNLDYGLSPVGVFADFGAGYVLNGWGGTDTIIGTIAGGEGLSFFNDIAFGNEGPDQFRPEAGNDYIDGRSGGTLVLHDIPFVGRGLFVDLAGGYENNPYGGHDRLVNVDSVAGTAWSDVIIGAAGLQFGAERSRPGGVRRSVRRHRLQQRAHRRIFWWERLKRLV